MSFVISFVQAPVVISRDHHDVSGTDSPFRETSNVYDGSAFCAGMFTTAAHNYHLYYLQFYTTICLFYNKLTNIRENRLIESIS